MYKNNIIEWILDGGSLREILKRLLITIVSIPVFIFLLIKFLMFIEKLKYKSYNNYGLVFNHLGIVKLTIAFICFLFCFMIIMYFIINKIKLIVLKIKRKSNNCSFMGPIRYYNLGREYYTFKKIFIILGIVFLFTGVYLINNTVLITKDRIIVENLIPFLEREYPYEEIKKVNIKIRLSRKRNFLKYTMITKDDKKIVINDEEIKKLLDLNERIKDKNIPIYKDTKYLSSFLEKVNSSSVENYKKLFE